MKVANAIRLIENATFDSDQPLRWADLGCGSGVFTEALASLLPSSSIIYAVDKTQQAFRTNQFQNTHIDFIKANFEKDDLALSNLDGVLMANSLHYVKDKKALIQKIKTYLNEKGQLIIIEYDTLTGNPWVPYPINYQNLRLLFQEARFKNILKLGERSSIYGNGNMYAAQIF